MAAIMPRAVRRDNHCVGKFSPLNLAGRQAVRAAVNLAHSRAAAAAVGKRPDDQPIVADAGRALARLRDDGRRPASSGP